MTKQKSLCCRWLEARRAVEAASGVRRQEIAHATKAAWAILDEQGTLLRDAERAAWRAWLAAWERKKKRKATNAADYQGKIEREVKRRCEKRRLYPIGDPRNITWQAVIEHEVVFEHARGHRFLCSGPPPVNPNPVYVYIIDRTPEEDSAAEAAWKATKVAYLAKKQLKKNESGQS